MTQLTLLAYNTLTGFSDYRRREALLSFVKEVNPDVAFFSDAFAVDVTEADINHVKESLRQAGYDMAISNETRYDRTDWTRTMGIVRISLNAGISYVKGTYQDVFHVQLQDCQIVGKYFDDRNEANRLAALGDITGADVVMGDFNAMHADATISKLLKLCIPLGNTFKEINTDFTKTRNPLLRVISLSQRLFRMAQGDLLRRIEELGFVDTNDTYAPTIHHLAQLDHIMVKKSITYTHFRVYEDIDLSDHKPIAVTVDI